MRNSNARAFGLAGTLKLRTLRVVLFLNLFLLTFVSGARTSTTPIAEYQIKAVFLFNFAQFVEWPPQAFHDANSPLIIGILGRDPFGRYLEDAVRGEKVNNRTLTIERYSHPKEVTDCHILFISDSEANDLENILAALKGRNILTVGDFSGFSKRGGMIRFVQENNKIRFRVNIDAVTAANLTVSSKLLRPAEIIRSGQE